MTGEILTEEQRTYYDQVIEGVIRSAMVGRNLIGLAPGSPFGFGVQSVKYSQLTSMSPAQLSMKIGENVDMIGITSKTIDIPVLHKEWEIDRRDLESSKRDGIPLDSSAPAEAVATVLELEDELILQGYSLDGGDSYEFKGLYQAADQSYDVAADFATAGNAIKVAKAAVKLLLKAKVPPPYNMVLNEEQYAEIVGPRSDSSDTTEMSIVKDILRGGDGNGGRGEIPTLGRGGNVYVTPGMVDGTGMIGAAPNPRYADLIVAQDIVPEYDVLPKSKNYFGRVFECIIPRVKRPEGFVQLTDIGSA